MSPKSCRSSRPPPSPPFCARRPCWWPPAWALQTLPALAQYRPRSARQAQPCRCPNFKNTVTPARLVVARAWVVAEDLGRHAWPMSWRLKAICRWWSDSNLKDVLSSRAHRPGMCARAECGPSGQMPAPRYIRARTVTPYDSNVEKHKLRQAISACLGSHRSSRLKTRITWRRQSVSSTAHP